MKKAEKEQLAFRRFMQNGWLRRIQLALGETLLLYTDGITEARNPSGVEYGRDALSASLLSEAISPRKNWSGHGVDDLTAFTADTELSDDRTLLALRRA